MWGFIDFLGITSEQMEATFIVRILNIYGGKYLAVLKGIMPMRLDTNNPV